ncbi:MULTISPECIES: iron uptake transporter deferrochelatase/peroxidase subunit [unclassified Vibrio]|uniref:Deferrochelatase n=1 Tax=Vibrio sp. HB236076 TaxID=3232307 RepID=A0AB39HIN2_9VIBR|nr:iron uptake transporter deferrochelatase/peroxidase subunit [Vibrio sp. HB161653]MDP5255132.1 iron uptake transporter deferrochelatase/peroxidase subunit [Vibrio sp. HB161653]
MSKSQTHKPQAASRRKMLKGLVGLAGGALAYSGFSRATENHLAEGRKPAVDDLQTTQAEQQAQAFYGTHQSGIVTAQQANAAIVAFDVLAVDKAGLQALFKILTQRSDFLMSGGKAPSRNDKYPPLDSGMLGPYIHPDNLTITVSVGASLFDERFGLSDLKPSQLMTMTQFPNDGLQSEWCHGDLLIQFCANSADTTLHALRDIIKHTPAYLSVKWRRDGFISPHAAASQGRRTPINLLGFRDGTVNPPNQPEVVNRMLWVNSRNEPKWAHGGSYQVVRLIRFFVEHWDRTPLQEQEAIFGRHRDTGAPIGKRHEHDDPDYQSDPKGQRILLGSHMRRANPRTEGMPEYLLLRRSYSYSYNTALNGQLDVGLLFIGYQADLMTGFIATQGRLNGEELEEYIKPFGGGYYFALPGVKQGEYLGQKLLET